MRPHIVAIVVAVLGCSLAAPALAGPAPGAHALIEQVLQAYGGRATLERVHAYRIEGEVFSAMRHTTAPIVRVFERPGRFKTLIDYAGGPEARLLDGARGWRNEHGDALEPASGPMLAAIVLQAKRADVPWILAEYDTAARLIPPVTRDGVALAGLEIPLGGGLVFRAYVNPETHLVTISQGLIELGAMRTHFETYYSDFRDADGVRFAFHEDNWASGVQTGVTEIKSVKLNPALGAREFEPPAATR